MPSTNFWLGGLVGLKINELYRNSKRDNEQKLEREKESIRNQVRAKLQRDFGIPPGYYEDILESDLAWNPLKLQNLDSWCNYLERLLVREGTGFSIPQGKRLPTWLMAGGLVSANLPMVAGETYEHRFKGESRAVFLKAAQVIQDLKYKITAARPMSEVIAFHTPGSMSSSSGQDMALIVAPIDQETANVLVAGSEHPGIFGRALTTWGERKRIAKNIFERGRQSP